MSDGVLIIDKPRDFTSFDVCALMRGLLGTKKIGHAGTLDPMATGVLPVLVGKATKTADVLPDHDKEYEASFRLGLITDTLDVWGEAKQDIRVSDITTENIQNMLNRFRGEITQIPPMYSAVSVNGRKLYDLARKGIEVERPERQVFINELELLSFDEKNGEGSLRCACSKGTYIRTLISDIGECLGCGAAMTALRRTRACGYGLENAVTIEEARRLKEEGKLEERLLPVESVFTSFRYVKVSDAQAFRVRNGGALALDRIKPFAPSLDGELVRIQTGNGEFLALGEVDLTDGELKMRKMFCQ